MDKKIRKLHLHMFDAGGEAGIGAEGIDDSGAAEPVVVYGKGESGEGSSQSGTDTTDTTGNQNADLDLDAEFDSLVKGKYKDVFGKRVSGAIDRRFKNYQGEHDRIAAYEDTLTPLYTMYGINPGDLDGLKDRLSQDDGVFQAAADKEGKEASEFRKELMLKAEAEKGRALQRRMEQQAIREARYRQLQEEASELNEALPGFNLDTEIQTNDEFTRLVESGVSVKTAFLATHPEDVIGGLGNHTAQEAKANVFNDMKQRAQRPAEGAATQSPPVIRKADPSQWDENDIDEVLKRVQNGEKISL